MSTSMTAPDARDNCQTRRGPNPKASRDPSTSLATRRPLKPIAHHLPRQPPRPTAIHFASFCVTLLLCHMHYTTAPRRCQLASASSTPTCVHPPPPPPRRVNPLSATQTLCLRLRARAKYLNPARLQRALTWPSLGVQRGFLF